METIDVRVAKVLEKERKSRSKDEVKDLLERLKELPNQTPSYRIPQKDTIGITLNINVPRT
jgi:hypothetical protein